MPYDTSAYSALHEHLQKMVRSSQGIASRSGYSHTPATRRVLHVSSINLKRICSSVQVQPTTLPAVAVADRIEIAGTLRLMHSTARQ
jgi:hypothetical protein